jgi:hypothetical protein
MRPAWLSTQYVQLYSTRASEVDIMRSLSINPRTHEVRGVMSQMCQCECRAIQPAVDLRL